MFQHPEPQVRHTSGFNDSSWFQINALIVQVIEQAQSTSEQHGHEVNSDLVDQFGL